MPGIVFFSLIFNLWPFFVVCICDCAAFYVCSHFFNWVCMKNLFLPGMVTHAFNPNTEEAEAGDLFELEVSLIYIVEFLDSQSYR